MMQADDYAELTEQKNLGHSNPDILESLAYCLYTHPSLPVLLPLRPPGLSALAPLSHFEHLSPAPVCVMDP